MDVALRDTGFDKSMLSALHDVLDLVDNVEMPQHRSWAYIRDKKAMKSTPADVMEYPNSHHFVVDIQG
ncbi:Hypothetical predicted protein [Olea europaea subsp. europaea]|uniref:Uncharacterized protein n=1 Tax=Olea europaea subsp. europaea TaxID=158383 RepID=A0A8S0PZS1_OLEEU|nr:Hypothetical predicted protein [Olea europaea subsp. europaea]